MAYAPSSTCFNVGDGTILGCFKEKEYGKVFEFSSAKDGDNDHWPASRRIASFPHRVWVNESWGSAADESSNRRDGAYRMAKVMKTVAYVLLDGDDHDAPLPRVEKWYIKGYTEYFNDWRDKYLTFR